MGLKIKSAEDYLFNDQVLSSGLEGYYRSDVIKMIEESQKDIIDLVLSNLPHTKYVENDIINRKNLKEKLFKLIDDESS